MCEPQANLVKRNILTFKADSTIATQAWDDRDFLASTDEGFRPVNLFNGPDGAMYVVDMHRGVMEYRAFTTPYYNERIAAKKLDTLLSAGRILRIVPKDKPRQPTPDLTRFSPNELVQLLKSNNGWLRDRAQHLLVYQQDAKAIPILERLLQTDSGSVTAIHALHTLAGLNGLSFPTLVKFAQSCDAMLASHALLLTQTFVRAEYVQEMAQLSVTLLQRNDDVINLYLPVALGKWNELSPGTFLPVFASLFRQVPSKAIYHEAIVSGLPGFETSFLDSLSAMSTGTGSPLAGTHIMDSLLRLTVKNKTDNKINPIFAEARTPIDARTNGLTLFRNNCASCHGADGDGIELVAPPLKGSEYVTGSTSRLAMIILNGLEGPIHINGQLYKFNNTMPTFANNLTNGQITDIIRFMHNAYVTTPVQPVTADEIGKLRKNKLGTLTEKDLIELGKASK
jgi:mono/diheme cytochrome c family protein